LISINKRIIRVEGGFGDIMGYSAGEGIIEDEEDHVLSEKDYYPPLELLPRREGV